MRVTLRSSSTTASRWQSVSAPTSPPWPARRQRARGARRPRSRGASRRHLPRQPPPGDGSGRGRADYVAFGSFFPSTTKDSEHRPEPELLAWWQALMEVPCVAIGGSHRRTACRWSRRAPTFSRSLRCVEWRRGRGRARFHQAPEIGSHSRRRRLSPQIGETMHRTALDPPGLPQPGAFRCCSPPADSTGPTATKTTGRPPRPLPRFRRQHTRRPSKMLAHRTSDDDHDRDAVAGRARPARLRSRRDRWPRGFVDRERAQGIPRSHGLEVTGELDLATRGALARWEGVAATRDDTDSGKLGA